MLLVHRRRLFGLLAMVLGFVLGLVFTEIGLRIVGWPAPGFYLNGHGPLELRPPGRNGGAYLPGAGRVRSYEFDVACFVNADGFRERELQPKLPCEWRIGFLGASMTAGVGVDQHERFSDVWYKAVYQQMPNMTVWNLASPRCGTGCKAEILNGVGRKYELDEIILGIFPTDVDRNFEWYQSGAVPVAQIIPSSLPESIRGWIREHSRLATFVWVGAIRGFAPLRRSGIYSAAALEKYWPATERALARMKEVVGPRPLTILYNPATPEWDHGIWQEMKRRYGMSDDSRFVVKQALIRWAQQNTVRFIDATPWLRRCSSAKECAFPMDGHWNPRGHHLVGEGLAGQWKGINGSSSASPLLGFFCSTCERR